MLRHDCLLHINADMTADYMLRHDCLLHILADMVTDYMLRHDCQVTYRIWWLATCRGMTVRWHIKSRTLFRRLWSLHGPVRGLSTVVGHETNYMLSMTVLSWDSLRRSIAARYMLDMTACCIPPLNVTTLSTTPTNVPGVRCGSSNNHRHHHRHRRRHCRLRRCCRGCRRRLELGTRCCC